MTEVRPARTGTLRHDAVPMRLYHEAKRLGAWDPQALDLSRDAEDWSRFSVAERDVLLRLSVLFQAAEESMTRDLLPLLVAVTREERLEEQLFLEPLFARDGHEEREEVAGHALFRRLEQHAEPEEHVPLGDAEPGPILGVARQVQGLRVPSAEPLCLVVQPHRH